MLITPVLAQALRYGAGAFSIGSGVLIAAATLYWLAAVGMLSG